MSQKRQQASPPVTCDGETRGFRLKRWFSAAVVIAAALFAGIESVQAAEYQWPEYSPTVAYDFNEDFGPIEPPTKILPGVSGVEGVYADDWWCFVWGSNANPQVTSDAYIPMIDRFNKDFAYITDVMGWPRDVRAQDGYYSTVYLFGSGLSTDSASNTDPGGWMGTTGWDGKPYHCVLASYIPVCAFDPATPDGYQSGAMIHEGIHAVFAPMPGGNNSAWAHESFNTWLQGTMESLRAGSFTGMGGLSAGSQIAPFIPIQCYSGWLQDGSFGGPGGQGVNKADETGQICTWRQILGGYQYGEAFPHAMEVILGPKSIPWMWNSTYSGNLLENVGMAPGGLGDAQMRHFIQEYRGRQAFCDFKHWSYAFRQLLHGYWMAAVEEEWAPYDVDVEPWVMTCYAATTNNAGTLTPEARTLPGWSGANQVPLTVDPAATSVSVDFTPLGANMSCQLVYRDTTGDIHYSDPVSSGVCSLPVADVLNDVVIAVVCNSDYIYVDDTTRTTKYDYRLTLGAGVTGQADIYTKWWDWDPETFTISASAGANGAISPSGDIVVDNGAVQTFIFEPAPGYEVADVLLNGLTVGSPDNYTLNPVLGSSTLEVVFRDATPPAAASALSATAVNGCIHLDWADNGESDLASYNVYRATTSGGPYKPIATGVATSDYADADVLDGTAYYYVVTAVDTESNESDISSEASAVAIDTVAPAAPTGLNAAGVGVAVSLDWADNTEPDVVSYTVYRSTTSGSGYTAITNVTSSAYADGGLDAGTTYYYVVTAVDASSNESVVSSEATPVSALLAHWDFNDPSLGAADGAPLPDSGEFSVWNTAAIDKSGNGNDLATQNYLNCGFNWSSNSQEGDFSIKAVNYWPNAFTWSSMSAPSGTDLELFTGSTFTVEAVATITDDGTWRTVLGRDAQNIPNCYWGTSALILGLDDGNHAWFRYVDVNGRIAELKSSKTYLADDTVFRHFAATTDGSTVSLYVDGELVAERNDSGMGGLAMGPDAAENAHPGGWSVGRGANDGFHQYRWYGHIDSVSVSETVLAPGAFALSDYIAPVDPVLAAPTGLFATPSDGTVALDWADNTEPELNYYTVYRSITPGVGYSPIRIGLTTSDYVDPRANNGTTYYYVVTASDADLVESDFSAWASATPVDVTPPAAPTGLLATAGNGSIALDWDDNTDPDFASYTIYRSTTGGSGYAAIASGLSLSTFVDNAVANNMTYYYVVKALDTSSLESSSSAEASATVVISEILSGTVIGTDGSWGNNPDLTKHAVFDGDLATYYDAVNASGDWAGLDLGSAKSITKVAFCPRDGWGSRLVGGQFQASSTVDFSSGVVTLFTISVQPEDGVLTEQNIADQGMYRYVRYLGPDGGYCNVAEVEFYTVVSSEPDTTAPAAPSGLTAAAGDASVSLNWDDSTEPDFSGYTVYRSTTSGSGYSVHASGLAVSSYTDGAAGNGTTYYYVVTATDTSFNESAASTEVSATPQPNAPAAPTGLSAEAVSSSQVDLWWNAVSGADSYTVKWSATSGGPYTTLSAGSAATGYSDTGVLAGTTNYYVVRAVNTGGESAASAEVSAETPVVVAWLPFDETSGSTAVDAGINGFDGSLVNGPLWATGIISNSVLLDGVDDYVQLPAGVVSSVGDFTIATWVYLNANTMWTRVFDFGSGETVNMFLTPQANSGVVSFAITTSGGLGEERIEGTSALPTGAWTHVAVTLNETIGTLYVNGVAVGTNPSMTLYPAALGDTTQNYIGKSQYADPTLNGALDDFLILGQALSAAEIAALAIEPLDVTAPAAPGGLSATAGDGRVDLDWADNAESDLDSYTVYRSTVSGSGYSALASALSSSAYTDSTAVNGTTYYYVVTAVDTSANQSTASSEVSATPQQVVAQQVVHVDAIALNVIAAGGPNRYGEASVTIVDASGQPVSGMTVTGSFSGSYSETGSAVTDASGVAVIQTAAKAKSPSFTFTVTDVAGPDSTYDAGSNAVTGSSY